jgi:hypothetical protein
VARRCRKVGAPRSATSSPPPGNRIVSLAGTAAADFPRPANPRSLSVGNTQYRGRATIPIPRRLSLFVGTATETSAWCAGGGRVGCYAHLQWDTARSRSGAGARTASEKRPSARSGSLLPPIKGAAVADKGADNPIRLLPPLLPARQELVLVDRERNSFSQAGSEHSQTNPTTSASSPL